MVRFMDVVNRATRTNICFIDVADEIDDWDVDDWDVDDWDVDDSFTIQTATRLFYTK